jgi:hypothetical protein
MMVMLLMLVLVLMLMLVMMICGQEMVLAGDDEGEWRWGHLVENSD